MQRVAKVLASTVQRYDAYRSNVLSHIPGVVILIEPDNSYGVFGPESIGKPRSEFGRPIGVIQNDGTIIYDPERLV